MTKSKSIKKIQKEENKKKSLLKKLGRKRKEAIYQIALSHQL